MNLRPAREYFGEPDAVTHDGLHIHLKTTHVSPTANPQQMELYRMTVETFQKQREKRQDRIFTIIAAAMILAAVVAIGSLVVLTQMYDDHTEQMKHPTP